jgi:hypothetical protein
MEPSSHNSPQQDQRKTLTLRGNLQLFVRSALACDERRSSLDPRHLIGVMTPACYLRWRFAAIKTNEWPKAQAIACRRGHESAWKARAEGLMCVWEVHLALVGLELISSARPPGRPDLCSSTFFLPFSTTLKHLTLYFSQADR